MKHKHIFTIFLLLLLSVFTIYGCNSNHNTKDIAEIEKKEDTDHKLSLKFVMEEEGAHFFYCSCPQVHHEEEHEDENGYTITQLPFPTFWGGEAYSIITPQKELYLIDGGFRGEDFERVKSYIDDHGGKVKAWILTHPHVDHIGAFIDYMSEYSQNVSTVYYAPFTREFFEEEPDPAIYDILNNPDAVLFYEFLQVMEETKQNTTYREMKMGDTMWMGDLFLECFSSFSPARHDVNANSLVFTISYDDFILGLTGDMTEVTLEDIKHNFKDDSSFFHTDILQIPHHGYMAGIASDILYRETKPSYALLDCTIEEFNNNSVNIQNHVQMIEDMGITVIPRFNSVNGNKIHIYPSVN